MVNRSHRNVEQVWLQAGDAHVRHGQVLDIHWVSEDLRGKTPKAWLLGVTRRVLANQRRAEERLSDRRLERELIGELPRGQGPS